MQDLWHGLTLAADMAWQSWWALVLGFTVAGAVQSFVSESRMTRLLGDSSPRSVALATGFGAASSSCSFGAVATARSLFEKGAAPAVALGAFQFASTNLVFELGLVMWILLGWQFVAANFAAGLILIVFNVLGLRFLVPAAWFEAARERLRAADSDAESGHHDHGGTDDDGPAPLFSRRGWTQASVAAFGEWRMLWKDILVGYLIAGLIAGLVPREWWASLFTMAGDSGFGFLLVSAVLGVAIGVVTFVCSIGNVPFAVVLWQGGIAFGGVMSFIFADLIVPTIVNAYRRYYGWRIALALFGVMFASAVLAGVVIHWLWHAIDLVPPAGTSGGKAPDGYTPILNGVFSVVFIAQALVARRQTP